MPAVTRSASLTAQNKAMRTQIAALGGVQQPLPREAERAAPDAKLRIENRVLRAELLRLQDMVDKSVAKRGTVLAREHELTREELAAAEALRQEAGREEALAAQAGDERDRLQGELHELEDAGAELAALQSLLEPLQKREFDAVVRVAASRREAERQEQRALEAEHRRWLEERVQAGCAATVRDERAARPSIQAEESSAWAALLRVEEWHRRQEQARATAAELAAEASQRRAAAAAFREAAAARCGSFVDSVFVTTVGREWKLPHLTLLHTAARAKDWPAQTRHPITAAVDAEAGHAGRMQRLGNIGRRARQRAACPSPELRAVRRGIACAVLARCAAAVPTGQQLYTEGTRALEMLANGETGGAQSGARALAAHAEADRGARERAAALCTALADATGQELAVFRAAEYDTPALRRRFAAAAQYRREALDHALGVHSADAAADPFSGSGVQHPRPSNWCGVRALSDAAPCCALPGLDHLHAATRQAAKRQLQAAAADLRESRCTAPGAVRTWVLARELSAPGRAWLCVAAGSADEQWQCCEAERAEWRDAPPELRTHRGFLRVAEDVAAAARPALAALRQQEGCDIALNLCGHSGGAAVAAAAAMLLRTHPTPGVTVQALTTLGCPKLFSAAGWTAARACREFPPLRGVDQLHYASVDDFAHRGLGAGWAVEDGVAAVARAGLNPGQLAAEGEATAAYHCVWSSVRLLREALEGGSVTETVVRDRALLRATETTPLVVRPAAVVAHRLASYTARLLSLADSLTADAGVVHRLELREYPYSDPPPGEGVFAASETGFFRPSDPRGALSAARRVRAAGAAGSSYPLLGCAYAVVASETRPLDWRYLRGRPLLRAVAAAGDQLRSERWVVHSAEVAAAARAAAAWEARAVAREQERRDAAEAAAFWETPDEPPLLGRSLQPLNLVFRAAAAERSAAACPQGLRVRPDAWRPRVGGWRAEGWAALQSLRNVAAEAAPRCVSASLRRQPCLRLGMLFRLWEEAAAAPGGPVLERDAPVTAVLWAACAAGCNGALRADLSAPAAAAARRRRAVLRQRAALTIQCMARGRAARDTRATLCSSRRLARRDAEQAELDHYLHRCATVITLPFQRYCRRKRAAGCIQRAARSAAARNAARSLRAAAAAALHREQGEELAAFAAVELRAAQVIQRAARCLRARVRAERRRRLCRSLELTEERKERAQHEREQRAAGLLGRAARRRLCLVPERSRLKELIRERAELLRLLFCERRLTAAHESTARESLAAVYGSGSGVRSGSWRARGARKPPVLFSERDTEWTLRHQQILRAEGMERTRLAAEERGWRAGFAACYGISTKEHLLWEQWRWELLAPMRCTEQEEWQDAEEALQVRVRGEAAAIRQDAELERIACGGRGELPSEDEIQRQATTRAVESRWWRHYSQGLREMQQQRAARCVDAHRVIWPELGTDLMMAPTGGTWSPEFPPTPALADCYTEVCTERFLVLREEAAARSEIGAAEAGSRSARAHAQALWWVTRGRNVAYVRSASARARRPQRAARGPQPACGRPRSACVRGVEIDVGWAGDAAHAPPPDPDDPEEFSSVPRQHGDSGGARLLRPLSAPPAQAMVPRGVSFRSPDQPLSAAFAEEVPTPQNAELPQGATTADALRLLLSLRGLQVGSLSLAGCGLGDEIAWGVCALLAASGEDGPERLVLSDCRFSGAAFAAVVDAVSRSPSLKVLDMSRSLAPDQDEAPPMFGSLAGAECGLTHVMLDGTGLGDASAASLAPLLAQDRLQVLSLADNAFGDASGHVLLAGLRRRTLPCRLVVSGNPDLSLSVARDLNEVSRLLAMYSGCSALPLTTAALPKTYSAAFGRGSARKGSLARLKTVPLRRQVAPDRSLPSLPSTQQLVSAACSADGESSAQAEAPLLPFAASP